MRTVSAVPATWHLGMLLLLMQLKLRSKSNGLCKTTPLTGVCSTLLLLPTHRALVFIYFFVNFLRKHEAAVSV